MSCHVRGSWTLIFIIWVFSHSSVDYTVSYSIKKKGWLIQYIDLQLEPNIYFSEFPRRSITSNLNNGCRWPRRVEEVDRGGTKESDDPNMISSVLLLLLLLLYIVKAVCCCCIWSNNGTDRICRTVEMGWSAQNIYSQIVTEWNRVKGCVWWDPLLQNRAQTPAHHSKSMLINNVMNNWKECFDVVHTKERKREGGHWTNKRNAFFNFRQWQECTIVCKVQ